MRRVVDWFWPWLRPIGDRSGPISATTTATMTTFAASLSTKILEFGGFRSIIMLIIKGWNYHSRKL